MKIAIPTIQNTPELTRLAHEHVVPNYSEDFNWLKTERSIQELIECQRAQPDCWWVRIIQDSQGIVGYLAGTLDTEFYNNDVIATVLHWFAQPNRVAGMRLINEFESWAVQRGAKHMDLGFNHKRRIHNLPERWLNRRGYAVSRTQFRKGL